MNLEPVLLNPAGKDYLWGGSRLKTEYGKDLPMDPLAETWECSAHPDGSSQIASGLYRGRPLLDVLKDHPEWMGSKVTESTGFPVLVKLIDAKQDLSVQVHPDDAFARQVEADNGKTEMWYVLEADPGARLACGFSHEVTKQQVRNAIEEGNLTRYLNHTPVHRGDVFFIPPGTVHAIGGGLLIAEIQQSSNITYRVYDYDRVGKDGKKRELHIEKALEVMDLRAGRDLKQKPRHVSYYPGCSREILCRCQYFETERIEVNLGFAFSVRETSFQVLLCTEGEAGISTDTMLRPLRFHRGECIFLPAGVGRCHVIGTCELLKVRC